MESFIGKSLAGTLWAVLTLLLLSQKLSRFHVAASNSLSTETLSLLAKIQ